MKKIIKKFWGVAFILALLSTLLVGAIPQAAANSYAWADAFVIPGQSGTDTTTASVGGFGVLDVAQSGSTIWAVCTDNAAGFYLYKSTNAGATWARVTPTTPPAGAYHSLIAVAPDNPDLIAVVDTAPFMADIVYYSGDGGNIFTALLATAADLNDIDMAPPLPTVGRYIAVGGHTDAVKAGQGAGYLAAWPVGGAITAWNVPANFANLGVDDVEAVAFAPDFQGSQLLLVLTETVGESLGAVGTNGAIGLHCYSYNQQDWDQNVSGTFPKYVFRTTALELYMARAQMVIDSNFALGDPYSEIVVIGTSMTSNVSGTNATQIGGVFRGGSYSIVGGNYSLTQIFGSTSTGGTAVNSVAWDGSSVLAAELGNFATGERTYLIENALATSGWVPKITTALKSPGTGNATLVLYNGGNGYAFSSFNGTMIGKLTSYGTGFNGVALGPFNSFGTMEDFFVMPDGSRTYAVTSDNRDAMVWRKDGRTWQRVGVIPAGGDTTVQNWLVRADKENKDIVYIARKGTGSMYRSTNGGETWSQCTCLFGIQDLAIQSEGSVVTVYVLVTASNGFSKSTNAGTTFSTPATVVFPSSTDNCFSLNLLSDNNILIGGTVGGFAYSTDGGATFSAPGGLKPPGNGNVLATATGLATGDWIFLCSNAAAPHANNAVYAWQVGVTNMGSFNPGLGTRGCTGIGIANGVLYVVESGAVNNQANRFLNPTLPLIPGGGIAVANDVLANNGAYNQTNMINTLQVSASGTTNTLWARNWVVGAIFPSISSRDTLDSLTDYVTTAADAPVATYPANDAIIPINSISGAIATFSFQWNAPPSLSASQASVPGLAYNYNLGVWLDAARTVYIAGDGIIGALAAASAQPACAVSSSGIGAAAAGTTQFTGGAGTAAAGTTYWWAIRVASNGIGGNFAARSQWSAVQSFVVEQLVAVVPIISSPENGGEVNTQNPAFSWSPIANATSYSFELALDANFNDIVYSVETTTAGTSVPSTIKLTRSLQYFWHVKALTPSEGEWSTTANFIVAELPTTTPQVTVTTAPQPTITAIITQPAATTTSVVVEQVTEEVNPSYIWAIIIVGAVLVIAVIVLIVRTRRSV